MNTADGVMKAFPSYMQVALKACREAAGNVQEVSFVLFSKDTFSVWRDEAEASGLKAVS